MLINFLVKLLGFGMFGGLVIMKLFEIEWMIRGVVMIMLLVRNIIMKKGISVLMLFVLEGFLSLVMSEWDMLMMVENMFVIMRG